MPSIWIILGGHAFAANGNPTAYGEVRVEGDSGSSPWEYEGDFDALDATINAGIKAAAVAAAEADGHGHTIGLLDKKTLFASATAL